tara:strand:- start:8958 stop:9131 length:174 start_codon:yes stop_codon:yes gene_type:complete
LATISQLQTSQENDMAKGNNRRGREEKKPKQKKTAPAPILSLNKGLTIAKKPKAKKT